MTARGGSRSKIVQTGPSRSAPQKDGTQCARSHSRLKAISALLIEKTTTSRQMCNQLINNKIDLWERRTGERRGQGREDSYFLTLCPCVCALEMCLCVPACMFRLLPSKTLILQWNLKKSIGNPVVQKIEQNVTDWRWWQFPPLYRISPHAWTISYNHCLWSTVWKQSLKHHKQLTSLLFDSTVRVIYISSVSCFMTETIHIVTTGSFFFHSVSTWTMRLLYRTWCAIIFFFLWK